MSPIIGANQPPIPPKETSQTHERAGVHNKGKNISSHANKRDLTVPQANVLTPKSINIGDALKLSTIYISSRTAKQVENKEDEVLTIVGDSWKQKRYQKILTAVHDNLRKDAEAGALIKQLKEEGAASETLKNKLLSMTVILSQSQFSQGDKRNQYKTFLSHFREAEQEISALSLNNSLEHKLLQKISRALFHCEPSSQFFTNLVQVACSQKAAKLKDSSGPSIAQRLKHTQKEIKENKAVLAD